MEFNFRKVIIYSCTFYDFSCQKYIYITGWGNEWKIDEQLNVFINYTDSDAGYNGLYYSLNY
jgi:hypothetical protein